MRSRWLLAAFALCGTAGPALAADIHVACYSDGNECEALADEATAFGKDNPDVHVIVDKSPYAAIMQSLPVQLAAGNGPDIARVTDFGPLNRYFLDLRPYLKDADAWEANFGKSLPWMRANDADKGIYGLPSQLTVTGLIVDKSLFDQAGVPLPGDAATWDDWAVTLKKVADADKVPFAMAWDRSGHRFAGPAISYGAKYFAADGAPIAVDDGVKAVASSPGGLEQGRDVRQGRLGRGRQRVSRRVRGFRQRPDRRLFFRLLAGEPFAEASWRRL